MGHNYLTFWWLGNKPRVAVLVLTLGYLGDTASHK
jgi:hypothetical protein